MNTPAIKRAELGVAILISLVVIFLLVVRATHAGALWRDECGVVQLAQMPTFAEMLANFVHQSYPPLFPTLIRVFTTVAGTNAAGLRSLGFIIALGVIGVAWFNSRRVGDGQPLLFLSLLGLNATFLTSGPSLRAYGLGCLLFLLTLGLAARALREPSKRNLIAVLIAASASIHIHLNNVPLIGAMAASAVIVFLIRSRFKHAIVTSTLAAVAALSFAPVWLSYAAADWSRVVGYPITLTFLAQKFATALGEPSWIMVPIWALVVFIIIGFSIWRLRAHWRDHPTSDVDLIAFLVGFGAMSIFAYFAMLKILRYPTSPWYYLPLMCACAGALDLIVAALHTTWLRIGRLVLAATALLIFPLADWHSVIQRDTNIDVVAKELEKNASAADLIIVNPWYFGVSFNWYYHGFARWMTVPDISDHRVHRYDLIKAKMLEQEPMSDVQEAIRQTLQSEHKVWVVGGARPAISGVDLTLRPAPDPQFGWSSQAYISSWSIQLGDFLSTHAIDGQVFSPLANGVDATENVPVLVARGWRD